MADQRKPSNTDLLVSALGSYPFHVAPIPGFDLTLLEVCGLLSHRSPGEVRWMLTLLERKLTELAESEDLNRFELPPPSFNWGLYGTGVWRGIKAIDERHLKALSIDSWEFVAAAAWRSLGQAISVIRSEPLGLTPTQPSESSLSAMKAVDFWLRAAMFEQKGKVILSGEKIRAASKKGNQSPHKTDESRKRQAEILKEAELLRSKNAQLSDLSIAEKISAIHPDETGFRVKTIRNVLKSAREK